MIAVDVFNWTSWGNREIKCLAPESLAVFDEVFSLLEQIETAKVNNFREVWLVAARGTIADLNEDTLADYCEQYGEEDSSNVEAAFFEDYPEESYWFKLESANDAAFRHLRLNRFVITLVEGEDDDYPHQCLELLEWIREALCVAIEQIRDGTYNQRLEHELPITLRYGTVYRRVYWECCPDDKQDNLKDLTKEEIDCFVGLVEAESVLKAPVERIHNVTFTQYFGYASHAFKAIGLSIAGKSPFEQFLRYGEDFGGHILQELDHDSHEDFLRYYRGELRMGGHPWGLLRGTSRSRIMLLPVKDESGWYFGFSGNPNWSAYEIVKMYLALKANNCPVWFANPEETVQYLCEEDSIGFVPVNLLCVYCHDKFPGMQVNDFRHIHPVEDAALMEHIQWLPLEMLRLKEENT